MSGAEGLMGAGIGLSAVGQLQQGADSAQNYNMQADAMAYNAGLETQRANIMRNNAAMKTTDIMEKYKDLQSNQIAAMSENGFGFGGSNLDILKSSEWEAVRDSLTNSYMGESEARNMDMKAQLDNYNAQVLRQNAKSAQQNSEEQALASTAMGVGTMIEIGAML